MDDMMAFILILIVVCLVLVYRKSKPGSGGYSQDTPLNPGTHRIGEDFPPGRGDFVALSGKGDVCVKKWGTDKQVLKFTLHADGKAAPDRYRNLTLRRFDTLEVNGSLNIMITPSKPFPENVTPELTQGIYCFGSDIPPAKYNLKVTGESGTVKYFGPNADEAEFSQEMGGDNATVYENLLCEGGGRMTIDGKLKLELTKSKKQRGRMQKILDFLNQTP